MRWAVEMYRKLALGWAFGADRPVRRTGSRHRLRDGQPAPRRRSDRRQPLTRSEIQRLFAAELGV